MASSEERERPDPVCSGKKGRCTNPTPALSEASSETPTGVDAEILFCTPKDRFRSRVHRGFSANALMLTQKSPQWRDRPNVGASSEFSRLFPLFNALLRFNLYVTSLFSTYCCKLTTAKFARQQRADLIEFFPVP
jgi:hypothetical protein